MSIILDNASYLYCEQSMLRNFLAVCRSLGQTNGQIASALEISTKTFERYRYGEFPRPLETWLHSHVGRQVLRALLEDFEETETPA